MISDASDTPQTEEDPYFNGYTRKVTSYALALIFGLVFLYGLFAIYKAFFSEESKVLADVQRAMHLSLQKKMKQKQRKEKELQYLYRREAVEAEWQDGAIKEVDEAPDNYMISELQIQENREANRV